MQTLLNVLATIYPTVSPQNVLLLSLELDLSMEFPAVWLISSTLLFVWTQKISKKQSSIVEVRAMLKAGVNMLRKGRKFQNEAVLIDSFMINFF